MGLDISKWEGRKTGSKVTYLRRVQEFRVERGRDVKTGVRMGKEGQLTNEWLQEAKQ